MGFHSYSGMSKSEVASTAALYADDRRLKMPKLTAASTVKELQRWLGKLGDREMDFEDPDLNTPDVLWASVAEIVAPTFRAQKHQKAVTIKYGRAL